MISMIGWFGALLLMFATAPQAYRSYKEKHSNGMEMSTLVSLNGGFVLMLCYTVLELNAKPALMANYIFNLIFVSIILWYKIFTKEK